MMINKQTKKLIKEITEIDISSEHKTWGEIYDAIPASARGPRAEKLRQICKMMVLGNEY